jgi:branched-chain amino acid transport system permease protein
MRRFWLVLLVLPPVLALTVLPPFGQRLVTLIGIYALLGLGYQLVFGQLGGLNLAQGALFGVGAYATALTAPALGLLAFVVAMLASAAMAALVAAPILRLQSHYFALATLALASLVGLVAINAESLTGGANGLIGFAAALPRGAGLLGLVWGLLIAGVLAYAALFKSPLGEGARLLREAPLAAATLGIDGGLWRFAALVIGAAIAGLAGACSASLIGVVSPEAAGFPIMLTCLTSVVLGGVRHPMGAVLGAALAVCLPELFRGLEAAWLLAYAAATLAVVLWAPQGLAGLVDRPPALPVPELPERLAPVQGARRLVLDRVTKRFGGVEALLDVSLALERGEIIGLIGPNGSGKTTLLNVIGGLERADSGTIRLDATSVQQLPAHVIARAGLGRTFQTPAADATRSAELARVLARQPAFLLLDEPAAGMGERDRELLVELLGKLRDAGLGVLIVDHDIELLAKVCDRLVCLDRGAVVAVGRPGEVRQDPKVRASFLGLAAPVLSGAEG